MPELGSLGSVRGAFSNERPYRESPFFALGLIAYGVTHLIVVGEPRQTLRSHAWTYLGWVIFGVCLTAIITTGVLGGVQIYIAKAISTKDQKLQKQAATLPVFWHLTDYNRAALAAALQGVAADKRFPIMVMCLPDAPSRAFVDDIGEVFLKQGWKIKANCFFNNLKPEFLGIGIGVSSHFIGKPIREVPKNAILLGKILNEARIPFIYSGMNGLKNNDVQLLIGNGPKS